MKHNLRLIPVVLALITSQAIAAKPSADSRPLIPLFKAEKITDYCDAGLQDLKKRVAALEKLPAAQLKNGKAVFKAWDALGIALEDLAGPFDLLSNVDPDSKTRLAMEPCLVKLNAFSTALYQNDKLFQKLKAAQAVDVIDAKFRQDVLDAFEDTGVTLPAKQQQRMKDISKQLDELSQEFSRNVRNNNQQLSFTPDEVQGLQADFLAKVKKDDKGNYLLGFDSPEYRPFMENADNSEARKRFQAAYNNRGSAKNLELMKQATELRREMAALFNFNNYADYVQRRRMAGNSAEVGRFLGSVQKAVTEVEKKELAELREFKAESLKQPLADTTMPSWDVPYWQEKLKRTRYQVDQNALRKYFPTEAAVPWALEVSSRLYGVEFKQVSVPVWDSDVRYYDVIDSTSKKRIAGIYLDLFPRDGKYKHAAAWPLRGVSTLVKRTPISVLVTNLDRQGLDSGELETLVHEFGHVLHGVLSNTRYVRHAGTSVELDFVEAPSQMYEEWARNKASLNLLAGFCKPACPTLDDDLLARMTAAHNYGRGIRFGRQLVYANFDMAMHGPQSVLPMDAWKSVEGATPLGYVEGTEFPGQFGHLMGGYGAGYYSYLWSEVMALDMLSGYEGKLMNPETGRRYRQEVLARGGELRGGALVRNFLGRPPNSKAFFAEITGQRLK
jgi:thimet oligopeptidase